MTSSPILWCMTNLEQSRSQIQDTSSAILTLSLIATFYLTKTGNGTKKCLTQISPLCLEYRYYFCQKMLIFSIKNTDNSKIIRVLVPKGIFSETKYVFEPSSLILTWFRQEGEGSFTSPHLSAKQTTKNPTQITVKESFV